MTIEDNKKYKLTGEQIKDLASRISILGSEAEEKAEKALSGNDAPTTSTSGQIGQLYIQDDGTVYILKDIIEESGDESGALAEFIWEEFGAGTEYTAGDGIDITNDVIKATNTGKARILTTADYNWPTTGTKTSINLSLLPAGIYYRESNSVVESTGLSGDYLTFIVGQKGTHEQIVVALGKDIDPNGSPTLARRYYDNNFQNSTIITPEIVDNLTSTKTGASLSAKQGKVLNDRIGDLTTLKTTAKTSAVAAINELADTVDDIEPQSGSGAPTSSTEGTIGQTYVDTSTGDIYYLSEIVEESGEPDTYVWNTFGNGKVVNLTSADFNYPIANPDSVALWMLEDGLYTANSITTWTNSSRSYGSSPARLFKIESNANNMKIITVYSATSADFSTLTIYFTSTNNGTDLATSPNATLKDIFRDPSTRYKVQIGNGAAAAGSDAIAIGNAAGYQSNGNYTIHIGSSAISSSGASGSISLGAFSKATSIGEMNIGSSITSYGYNSSNYRLLTGLYDPQSAHDAATKGYVDSLIGGITGFSYQIVSTLPVSGEKGVIYLVPTEESGDPQNIYEEYIWMIDEEDSGDTGRFELIGTTEIDLSDYVTNSDLQTTLSNYATTSDVSTAISGVEQEIGSLSGSGAPTSATEGTVGQTYVDSSTGDIYYLSEIIEESGQADTYVWKSFASGDTITPLTSANYNWNNTAGDSTTTPFDSIALWLLDPGIYTIAEQGIYIKGELSHWAPKRVGDTILITPPASAGPYIMKGVFFTSGEGISHYSPTITTGSNFVHKGDVLYSDSIGYARKIDSELYNAASQSGGANDYCQIWRLPSGTYYGIFDTVLVQEYSQGPLIPSDDTIYIISDASGGLSSRCILKITTEGAYKLNFTSGEYVSTEKLLTEGDISITMTNTDPGEGATVNENEYIAVYGGDPIILDYSTSEVNTGTKWIDGSTIYKKTVSTGTLPDTNASWTQHGISNMSKVIKIEGYATDGTTFHPLPYANTASNGSVAVQVTSTNIMLSTTSDQSAYTESYITLYYTKSSS